MRISDWSSDVCSSDLVEPDDVAADHDGVAGQHPRPPLDVGPAVRDGESEYRRRGKRGGPKMCGRMNGLRVPGRDLDGCDVATSTRHLSRPGHTRRVQASGTCGVTLLHTKITLLPLPR